MRYVCGVFVSVIGQFQILCLLVACFQKECYSCVNYEFVIDWLVFAREKFA